MPRLLELALECEEYQSLPYSGGVMDQPAGLLRKLRQVGNVYRAFREYERKGNVPVKAQSGKKIHGYLEHQKRVMN